jgi:hypothetical protein
VRSIEKPLRSSPIALESVAEPVDDETAEAQCARFTRAAGVRRNEPDLSYRSGGRSCRSRRFGQEEGKKRGSATKNAPP